MLKVIIFICFMITTSCTIHNFDGGQTLTMQAESAFTPDHYSYLNGNQGLLEGSAGVLYINSLKFGNDSYKVDGFSGASVTLQNNNPDEIKNLPTVVTPKNDIKIRFNRDFVAGDKDFFSMKLIPSSAFTDKQLNLSNYNVLQFSVWASRDCYITAGIGEPGIDSGAFESLPIKVTNGGYFSLVNDGGVAFQRKARHVIVRLRLKNVLNTDKIGTLLKLKLTRGLNPASWNGLELYLDDIKFSRETSTESTYDKPEDREYNLLKYRHRYLSSFIRGLETLIINPLNARDVCEAPTSLVDNSQNVIKFGIKDHSALSTIKYEFYAFEDSTLISNATFDLSRYSTVVIKARASRNIVLNSQLYNTSQSTYSHIGSMSLNTEYQDFQFSIENLNRQFNKKLFALLYSKTDNQNWGAPAEIYIESIKFIKPGEKLAIPQNLTAVNQGNSIKLTWNRVPGATLYRVTRAKQGEMEAIVNYSKLIVQTANLEYTDNSVLINTGYHYRVQAYSPESGYSDFAELTNRGLQLPLPVPSFQAIAGTENSVNEITWSYTELAQHYLLFRKKSTETEWTKLIQKNMNDSYNKLYCYQDDLKQNNGSTISVQYKLVLSNDFEVKESVKTVTMKPAAPRVFSYSSYGSSGFFSWRHSDYYVPVKFRLYKKPFSSGFYSLFKEFNYEMEKNTIYEPGPGFQAETIALQDLGEGHFKLTAVMQDGTESCESSILEVRNNPLEKDVLVFIEKKIFDSIKTSYYSWENQLVSEGYHPKFILWNDSSSDYNSRDHLNYIKDLKRTIKDHYQAGKKLYVILAGDLPIPYFEFITNSAPAVQSAAGLNYSAEYFPFDFYYMDMDGNYSDSFYSAGFKKGAFDTADVSPTAEVMVSRIPGTSGELKNYFTKNVLYRQGKLAVPAEGYYFASTDFLGLTQLINNDINALKKLYQQTDTDNTRAYADAGNFFNKLKTTGAELTFVFAHGSPSSMSSPDGQDSMSIDKFDRLNLKSVFWVFRSCSVGRYTDLNGSLASSAILHNDYGLVSVAGTAAVMVEDEPYRYLDRLNEGKTAGEAFNDWLNNYLRYKVNYGHLFEKGRLQYQLFGDPTLKISSVTKRQLIIN